MAASATAVSERLEWQGRSGFVSLNPKYLRGEGFLRRLRGSVCAGILPASMIPPEAGPSGWPYFSRLELSTD